MRHNKKKIVLTAVIAALLLVLAALVIIALGSMRNQPQVTQPDNSTTRPTQQEKPDVELEEEDVAIETPYGKLRMPGVWAEELIVTVDQTDGYKVLFHGKFGAHDPIKLFAVSFGGSEGTVVHTIYTENNVPCEVRLQTFPLEMEGWSNVDQATARAMQEDLNHLLAKLRGE